jgi:diaminohydroxyphosphoribosylaminopyrimidine deaminase / 5-amino-6-(5-phosphoribosylamino)uracil reductase
MATSEELEAMRRAIITSARGLGTVSPNPPVGCVVLDEHGITAGEGFHKRKGEPHAETQALAAAGNLAEGATAVITLEPCNHVGRTPACSQALLNAGVARVVVALIDPTSRGMGGVAALRESGVDVEVGVLQDEAMLVLGPWLTATATHRPHVTCARAMPHESAVLLAELRTGVDAVLDAQWHIEEGIPGGHGADMLQLPDGPVSADQPEALLAQLFDGGVRTLLVDGDSPLAFFLLRAGLVDRVVEQRDRDDVEIPPGYRLDMVIATGSAIRVVASRAAGDYRVPGAEAKLQRDPNTTASADDQRRRPRPAPGEYSHWPWPTNTTLLSKRDQPKRLPPNMSRWSPSWISLPEVLRSW